MIDGLVQNFKKSIIKASDKSFSLANATNSLSLSGKPINVIGSKSSERVTLTDLHIEGLTNPKIMNVYVNKQNLKLHVSFLYNNIRVSGRCITGNNDAIAATGGSNQAKGISSGNKILLEANGWNAAWSANLMNMVGRDAFDTRKVYTIHTQQRLSSNLKDCHQILHEKLKTSLMERVKSNIDDRLVEIMETVIMHNQPSESIEQQGSSDRKIIKRADGEAGASGILGMAKQLLLDGGNSPKRSNPLTESKSDRTKRSSQSSSRPLKRVKRQTPCQPGEELDDYVDQLFKFGSRIIRAMEPMTLPNTTIELPDYNLKIFLYEGKGTRAYNLRRVKPAWVFCNNETISLGITVEVEELQVAYKYRVISGYRLLFDGDLEARLTPRAQAQFSQKKQDEDSEDPVQQRVDRVRLFRAKKVHVVIRGLGNLTQSLSMMINSYLNDNQEDLQPTFRMAEGDAVRVLNRLLANVSVPLLSTV